MEVFADYRCTKCHRIYTRKSRKRWIKSYCSPTGQRARLYRVVWPPK